MISDITNFHAAILHLDPTVPFEERVRCGGFDYVNPCITPKRFPLTGSGWRQLVILEADAKVTSEAMLGRIEAAGVQPATLDDALALAAQYQEFCSRNPVVFLGTIWRDPIGLLRVPVFTASDGRRSLSLFWFGRVWSKCSFAVVGAL